MKSSNSFATKQDLDRLESRLIDQFSGILNKKFGEVMNMIDEVMGELRNVREEQTILSSQHGRMLDLEEKMEKVENIHPKWTHSSV